MEHSQLWDHEMARKQGYVVVTKLSPHMWAYIVICAETGIGLPCGSQWSTHETVHVKPLVLMHIGLTLGSFCPTHETAIVLPQTVTTCKSIFPHICITWSSQWSAYNIAHVNSLLWDILVKLGPHIVQPMEWPVKSLFVDTSVRHGF